MATTQISNIIVPEVFNDYISQDTMQKAAVRASGLLVDDSLLSTRLSGGGTTFNAPTWADLADTDPTISNDDPTSLLVLEGVGTYKEVACRMTANKGWSAMQFASQLAGSDAMQRIGDRVAAYWDRQDNFWTLATIRGVLGSNQANNAADMYHDAGAASMSGTVALDAAQKLGDAQDKLTIMIVHSRTMNTMKKQGLLTNAFTSEDKISAMPIMTYQGKYKVVVDDAMPNGNAKTLANPGGGASINGVALGANEFISVLCAPGVIAKGTAADKVPVEMDRAMLAGGGSGEEQLVTRKIFTYHPRGHIVNTGGFAGTTPTLAELELSATWTRTYPEQKQMGMVGIQTTEA